ncbi:MAG TPA: transporter substrate-binding domain-containing protein, partial [Bellilinea sp.]
MKNSGLQKQLLLWLLAIVLAPLAMGLAGKSGTVSAQTTSPIDPTLTPISASAQRPIVRVGGSATNPPYEYLDNGQPAGFSIDLLKAVGREMGFDVQFVLTDTEQARQDLLDGKLDMLAGLAYSTNR